jgi:acyl-CoA thioester hydrolase
LSVDLPTDREVHVSSVKVRFYELDPYDHVNHTNYFSYFETARIDYLTDMGWGLDRLKEQGWQLVVVDLNARFSAAARFGEELTIHTWIEEVGRVKSTWRQVMFRGDGGRSTHRFRRLHRPGRETPSHSVGVRRAHQGAGTAFLMQGVTNT